MGKAISSFRGKYAFLSNMYEAPFEWDGRMYRNSEAAFQSAKTLTKTDRDRFSEVDGKKAKRMGRNLELRGDWGSVRDGVMEEVVRAKFSQNPDLLRQLIDTGSVELIEGNSWHDVYWGVDKETGEGENHLGIILMKIRSELGAPGETEETMQEKAEEEAAGQHEADPLRAEKEIYQAELSALPVYDFTGMEMMSKAFGRVKILSQEGNRLTAEAGGQARRFAYPDAILQGFLIPDDPQVIDVLRYAQTLENELRSVEKAISERESAERRQAEAKKTAQRKTVRRREPSREEPAGHFVQYAVDPETEKEWMEKDPGKSISSAAIFVPEGAELSEQAMETIRAFCYFQDGTGGLVLLSDQVVVPVKTGTLAAMAGRAKSEAEKVLSEMPDFEPLEMDDGTGLLHMCNGNVYGFRPFSITEDGVSLARALEVRQDCLEACSEGDIVAIVYCSGKN